MRAGNLDQAVAAYRKAVQASPDNANYKIALQRAMLAASRAHLDKAHEFEQTGSARGRARRVQAGERIRSEQPASRRRRSPSSIGRSASAIEAARPKPAIQALRERARAASAEPLLNPASREPLNLRFNNASLRDILNVDRRRAPASTSPTTATSPIAPTTVQLDGVTLEQALNQIMTMNQLSYKVLSERSIFVFPDTPPKHAQYDEQVDPDVLPVARRLDRADADPQHDHPAAGHRRAAGDRRQQDGEHDHRARHDARSCRSSRRSSSRTTSRAPRSSSTSRSSRSIASRAKNYGLNLSEYALGGDLLAGSRRRAARRPATGGTGAPAAPAPRARTPARRPAPSAVTSPPPFNLNTISRGVSTADFYLAVPTAIVRFLESDTHTKIIAKPQLRGAEGTKLTLNLGQQIPIVSTSYTPIATGGAGVNPLSSYQYKDVGVNIDMTPTRDARRRHPPRPDAREQLASGADIVGRRRQRPVVRPAHGDARGCGCATASRTCSPACCRTNDTKGVTGFPGRDPRADPQQLFCEQHTSERPDRHRDAADAAHRADARDHGSGSEADLHRLAAEPRHRRTAAADRAAAAGSRRRRAAAPAPAAGVRAERAGGSTPTGTAGAAARAAHSLGRAARLVAGAGHGRAAAADAADRAAAPPPPPPAPVAMPPPPPCRRTAPRATAGAAAGTAAAAPTPPAARRAVPTTSPGIGSAQVLISPPATTFRVGGGPYTVPLSITDASRLSTITLTLIFDPTKLRVRTVQEGSFMRAGGVAVDVHAAGQRQPRRHHAGARRRRDRRVRHRPARRDALRRDRAGHRRR